MVSDDPLDEELFCIKVRLSTTEQEETELNLRGGDTIVVAKMKLAQQISNSSRQRWFYSGQLLEDRLRIRDLNIPQGHIVQVVFSDLPTSHSKEQWTENYILCLLYSYKYILWRPSLDTRRHDSTYNLVYFLHKTVFLDESIFFYASLFPISNYSEELILNGEKLTKHLFKNHDFFITYNIV